MYVCTHIVTSVTTCLHPVLQLLYEPWERGLGTCMHSVQYSHMYEPWQCTHLVILGLAVLALRRVYCCSAALLLME